MPVLDVGGVYFRTSWETLRASDSFFSGLASCACNEEDTVFIDRDPTHFRVVLNFLRGCAELPPDKTSLRELRAEAEFYCLDRLASAVDEKLRTDRPKDGVQLMADLVDVVGNIARVIGHTS